jgi:LacI family transcriptional regulator
LLRIVLSSKKPTIDDVAALSNVGRTTVSRVLNGSPNVRAVVRERVLKAVETLDFRVNAQARFLAGGRSQTLALIHASDFDTEPNSFYHSGIELGALRASAEAGFQLVMQNVNQQSPNCVQVIIDFLSGRRFDGVILTPPFSDNRDLVVHIQSKRCPVVCIAPGIGTRDLASGIGIDDEAAGFDMTMHLIACGHKSFGYIKGLEGHLSAEGRYDGFCRALKASDLDPDASIVVRGAFTFRSGVEMAEKILEQGKRPTAIICANDDMAAGALLTLHKHDLRIPQDISVVGFDDTPVSEIVWPPLTTVHQPIKTMGYRAVEILIESLGIIGKRKGPVFESIAHKLVMRNSSLNLTV